jgi:hypothetical protein
VAGIAAAALVACSTGFAYHALTGLETALYACLLTWGVLGLVSLGGAGIVSGGIALAVAALARPEAPLVCVLACGAAALARGWRRTAPVVPHGVPAPVYTIPWRAFGVAGLLVLVAVLGQLAFRRWNYDGEWLPNTFFAKAGGSGDRVTYAHDALRTAFLGDLGLLLALAGWLLGGRPVRAAAVPAVVGAIGAMLPLFTGGDWMPASRLVVPYLPLLAVTVTLGWARLLARARRGGTGLLSVVLLLSAPVGLAFGWPERVRLAEGAAIETAGARTGHAALAAWLREHARPADTIALMDIGEVGYRCSEQRILDVTGLTDRHIGKSPGTFMDKRFDLGYVWARHPDFIVLTFMGRDAPEAPLRPFSPMEERLALDPEFQRDFVRAASDTAANALDQLRISLGADALFPYATPGRRYVLAVYRRGV